MPSERTFYRRLIKIILVCSFCLCIVLSITVALIKDNAPFRISLLVILSVCVCLTVAAVSILIIFRKYLHNDPRHSRAAGNSSPGTQTERIFTVSRSERNRNTNANTSEYDYEAPPPYDDSMHTTHHSNLDMRSVTIFAACSVSVTSEEEIAEEVKDLDGLDEVLSDETLSGDTNNYDSSDNNNQNCLVDSKSGACAEVPVGDATGEITEDVEDSKTLADTKEPISPPPYPGEIEVFKHLRATKKQP